MDSSTLNFDIPLLQIGISIKILEPDSKHVDPDEMARYEPSHLDLQCLHKYLFWSTVSHK